MRTNWFISKPKDFVYAEVWNDSGPSGWVSLLLSFKNRAWKTKNSKLPLYQLLADKQFLLSYLPWDSYRENVLDFLQRSTNINSFIQVELNDKTRNWNKLFWHCNINKMSIWVFAGESWNSQNVIWQYALCLFWLFWKED